MSQDKDLEALMNKYREDLMKIYEKRSPLPESEETKKASAKQEPVIEEKKEEETPITEKPEDMRAETNEEQEEAPKSFASFYAFVGTGMGAFPVINAKVTLKKGNELVAFLVTDENGKTPKIEIPAFSEESTLSAETVKPVNYSADVYAEGFIEQKGLEVSALGGSQIVLNVEMIPNEERME